MDKPLSDAAFLILGLLAEKENHGHELEKLVRIRGFRYWTEIERSSIYLALKNLEKKKFVEARLEQGSGPVKKIFHITALGKKQLKKDTVFHLSTPDHPRNEIDLGIYAMSFLKNENAIEAVKIGIDHLEKRRKFLSERLSWCRKRNLEIPALGFERPLLSVKNDISWLKKVLQKLNSKEYQNVHTCEWQHYEFKSPPEVNQSSQSGSS